MFTPPPFTETTQDAMPLRRYPQPLKFNVSNYTLTVTEVGQVRRACPVLPLGSGPNDRTTEHVRILSQVIKYNFVSAYGTNNLVGVQPQPDGVRIIYIIDKLCGLMSGNGSWLPPSDVSGASYLLGARPSTPRITTLACRNHINADKYAFIWDARHDFTKVYSGATPDNANFYFNPRQAHGIIPIYGIDIDVQYTADGTGYAGQVPFLSMCTDYQSASIYLTVSTVFIDSP